MGEAVTATEAGRAVNNFYCFLIIVMFDWSCRRSTAVAVLLYLICISALVTSAVADMNNIVLGVVFAQLMSLEENRLG